MELLVFCLAILVVGAIIGISMVSFRVAFTSLVKVNLLEKELSEIKTNKNVKKL